MWVLFLLYPLYRVLWAQKTKLVVKDMSFSALLLFDQKAEHHEPIQMPNYDLSIWAPFTVQHPEPEDPALR